MKYAQFKKDPTLLKGIAAEKRLVDIIRSLREDTPWVGKVRLAGTRQDQVGIDILVFIQPQEGGVNIKVPIQVKSSYEGFKKYLARYPENVEAGVLVVVVNPYYSDESLKGFLKGKFEDIRNIRKNFNDFFVAKKELIKSSFPIKTNSESQIQAFNYKRVKRRSY